MFAINESKFFADFPQRLRVQLTSGRRSGLEFLVRKLGADPGFRMIREVAYVLATVHWETAATFQPIREKRASQLRNPQLWQTQNRYWSTGYYGRGYVQLTWETNYRQAGVRLAGTTFTLGGRTVVIARDTFVRHPDYLLEPEVSYVICSRGMREGWFTGKKLAHYIKQGLAPDYTNARRIINGTDHAADIAALAAAYELLLRGSLVSTTFEPVVVAANEMAQS